jgi:hypothetical protein
MKAKSIKGSSPEEIQAALKHSMQDSRLPDGQGFAPTLAIVFISIKHDRKAVCKILAEQDIDIVGATSSGEFINGHQSEGEAAILLIQLDRKYYSILWEEIGDRTVEEASGQLALRALEKFENPSLIICSTGINANGEFFHGERMVKTIEEKIGADKVFFGGMAGDDMTFTGTYVFTGGKRKETDAGLVALLLDGDKISLLGMAITGWKPMGISRTVTKSKGTKVFTIDNTPAVEMYLKYLGKEEKRNDEDFKVFEELGFTYPFITQRANGVDTVLRSPIKIDYTDNSLVLDIEMPEGTRFWFATPPDFDIVDEVLHEATQLMSSNQAEADALLIFSCAGRNPVLGPLVTAENDGLANVWQTPMAGFFTYGEYGRSKNGNQEFHSGACCWVALKEKES